ncbi:dehydrodolichyl diphosphate syntase complex subunit [Raphidocelis subcapitata]|uniref:Alkyl transferase n=1 Tax=Raphidocelis subcapitata TaxID=307507 RepID=A0A2V0NY88_9CHLO|nr:dehydrodolichyl diphosphate syntase complex subunit [Raphidocelis subcapitata]|eukprot:GBF92299.1 dehydrodolichyl diphosphate syntase complex subunit [Raphidocelis subcapitata]
MWWPVRRVFQALLLGQPVPQHVAFIMDGNRRYADCAGVAPLDGHASGYKKMVEVIKWCFELGVRHVSVYAFSIDNFRRSADEVEGLMRLAADKFDELTRDEGARAWGAELRIIGDLQRLPPGVAAAAARLMRSSAALAAAAPRGAPPRVVNVCFPYTSTQELAAALGALRAGLARGALLPADVDTRLLLDAMHTRPQAGAGSPPVDLVLRTSGEERLSDFMLWQSGGALLTWLPVLWPQLGFLDLLRALRAWQEARPALRALEGAAAGAAARGCSPPPASDAACGGGGGGGAPCSCCSCGRPRDGGEAAAAGAAALASIREEAASCAPHPSKQLRTEGFLTGLEAVRQEWISEQHMYQQQQQQRQQCGGTAYSGGGKLAAPAS